MLALRNPHDAYRRIEFDARVAAARPDQLVALCYDELALALGSAIRADQLGDNQRRSAGLTRALAALTALQIGIDPGAPAAPALQLFYAGLRQAVLDSVPNFVPQRLSAAKRDVEEVAAAVGAAADRSILDQS
ncbi:MAG: flagellin [Sphingomonadaceae bacterium]|nr:flagellin [Sphingomonadaceae bacterium]